MNYRCALTVASLALLSACATTTPPAPPMAPPLRPLDYALGADLSFLRQAEQRGAKFKDAGVEKPGLQIFRDHGYNWIRLRLFHTPTQLPNNLAYTLATAKEAKALGFKFLLDFHYSDTWADPAKQFLPKAWEGKPHAELVQAVHDYTRDTIAAFRAAGVMPDMVQIGNEITPGMLWPDGKLPNWPGNSAATEDSLSEISVRPPGGATLSRPAPTKSALQGEPRLSRGSGWDNFTDLLKAGIAGVEAASAGTERPRIMIHIDKGGDRAATKRFFDGIIARGVTFDVIGQSYYPWWHGTLLELRDNLAFMAETYDRDIVLVEVAYNWKPAEYRDKPAPFPETAEGQRQFLDEVNRLVLATPHGRGKGIFWWEPAVTGGLGRRGMFDDQQNALPVLGVFDKYTRGKIPPRAP